MTGVPTYSYSLPHEQWTAIHDRNKVEPEVYISSDSRLIGESWSFVVKQHDFSYGETAVHLEVFGDSFLGFAEAADFVAAMREAQPKTLAGVVAVLKSLGVRDATNRDDPTDQGPVLKAVRAWESGWSVEAAEEAATAFTEFAEKRKARGRLAQESAAIEDET